MKKKIIITTILAALVAVPVFAAATADQDKQQPDWFNQMLNNHKQMVQQAVDNGIMTADQADWMNEHMQQMFKTGMMNGNFGPRGDMVGNCYNR